MDIITKEFKIKSPMYTLYDTKNEMFMTEAFYDEYNLTDNIFKAYTGYPNDLLNKKLQNEIPGFVQPVKIVILKDQYQIRPIVFDDIKDTIYGSYIHSLDNILSNNVRSLIGDSNLSGFDVPDYLKESFGRIKEFINKELIELNKYIGDKLENEID